jgi:hypothetical protein
MNITSQQQFDELTKLKKTYRFKRTIDFTLAGVKYHSLIHIPTGRPLCISYWEAVPNILAESTLNTTQRFWVNSVTGSVITKDFDSSNPWLWQWDSSQIKYLKSDPSLTFDEKYFYILIAEKAAVLDIILHKLQHYRRMFSHDYLFQQDIYRLKANESLEIIKNKITDMNGDFPFTEAYAEFEGIDLQTAAQSINIQDKFFQTRMLNTEMLRLKYLRKIKDCSDVQQLHPILNDFYKEGEVYGRL